MSSKGKIRRKKHLKQALRRMGTCMVCAPLLPYQTTPSTAQKFGAWPCPSCGRQIALDFGGEDERKDEAMHALASAYAYHQKIHIDGFAITYDGEPVYEVPACDCGPAPCSHANLVIHIESPHYGE